MKHREKITHSFFERDPLVCARELIGCELVWDGCAGIIVETEAYSAQNDEACHTFARKGARAFVATHIPGSAYVYLNYGIHWLLNVLVKGPTQEGFVLIRALEPVRGIAQMQIRRKQDDLRALCSGPGKLGQAIGVAGTDHGIDLCKGTGRGFCAPEKNTRVEVVPDFRIGISKAAHLPWRFLLKGSPYVSVAHSGEKKAAGKK